MKRCLLNISVIFMICVSVMAQQKEVKNVIVMIPDGTSMGVLPIARWYNGGKPLHLDPYICGLVRTHCSNAPIGDSAPTSSTYASGELSEAGYVATYPPKSENFLFPEEKRKYDTYQPLFTVMEAAKLQNKATGLIATSEFTNATPADFSAHTYKRSLEYVIGKQIVNNKIDVVFSGGHKYLYKRDDKEDLRLVLKENGVTYTENINEFRNLDTPKAWALFADNDLEYDILRDPSKEPSLAEMTAKALELLSKNKNGFFLMVEGSKVDWAAHNHNTKCTITDFIAFDEAVGTAIDFAKRNGNTAIVVLPDHGNGGLNINSAMTAANGYSTLPLKTILEPLKKGLAPQQYGTMAEQYARKNKDSEESFDMLCAEAEKTLTKNLSGNEKKSLRSCYDIMTVAIKSNPEDSSMVSSKKGEIENLFNDFLNIRSYFGWIAPGHTGEDVFLAAYHPNGYRPEGVVRNTELNAYLQEIMGISSLEDLTCEYFSPLAESNLKKGDKIDTTVMKQYPILTIKHDKKVFRMPAYTNKVYLKKGRKDVLYKELSTVIIYMAKNNTFYLPKSLKEELGY